MQTEELIEYLVNRAESTSDVADAVGDCHGRLEAILCQRTGSYHGRFSQQYWPLDPDNDARTPTQPQSQSPDVTGVLEICESMLTEAGYQRVSQSDVEQCVGVASQWSVPLHVDFTMFEHLRVYARGDIVGTKLRRRLRKLYRPEPVSVPTYQRMFVMFQLTSDDESDEELLAESLHLRMFKNIPKQDVDSLLPGTRVRIRRIDQVKIFVPSLGGLLISIRKIIQLLLIFAALTLYSSAILIGLVLAVIGYVVKSVLSYFQTKNRYLLNLTRNLYFQKLDANAGAAYRLIQQAHRQSSNETILVYYAIVTSDQPISNRKLQRRCERLVREAINVEVDFRVDQALERLREMGRIRQQADQRWVAK